MSLTIITFIITLSILVLVHEIGHFVIAKRAGVRVDEFGLGYPPRVFGIKKGGTIYSINLLPFGGFVKIYGESGKEEGSAKAPIEKRVLNLNKKNKEEDQFDEKNAFYNQSIFTRTRILAAGVIMNLLLAAILLSFGNWLGLPTVVDDEANGDLENTRVQIVGVASESPAEEAGIKIGDTITKIKNKKSRSEVISTVEEVQNFIGQHKGQEVIVTIQRGDEVLEKTALLRKKYADDEGSLGVALARTGIIRYPWYRAIFKGFKDTIVLTGLIVATLASLLWQWLTSGQVAGDIAGPVGIFQLTGQAAQLGFIYVLQFISIFSINLAIINILPFPALDGGRLLFLLIEKIKGSPVSQKIERIVHTAGFAALILLMLAITWRDIARFF